MTKDQLLAGFLDRSLSEDAMLQFQELRSADPAFAQHVNDMMSVEQLLGSATPAVSASAEFLTGVENIVAAQVAAGTSGGFLSGVFSSMLTWIGVTGVVLVGAGALYFSQQDNSTNTIGVVPPAAEQQKTITSQQSQQLGQSELLEAAPELVSQPVDGRTPSRADASAPAQLRESTRPPSINDIATNVETQDLKQTEATSILSDKTPPALEALVQKLDGCIASNKHKECSQIALQVGHQFMRADNSNSATKYYLIALDEARISRIVDYQVMALGNLGTAALKNGHEENARRNFNDAITLGSQNSIDVEQWRTALSALK